MRIDLYSRGGARVTTVVIPPFNVMPEIIQWGARHFVRGEDGKYREGLSWFVNADASANGALDRRYWEESESDRIAWYLSHRTTPSIERDD